MIDFNEFKTILKLPTNIIAITGHRPSKLGVSQDDSRGGYDWHSPVRVEIRKRIRTETQKLLNVQTQDTKIRNRFVNAKMWDVKWTANDASWRDLPVLCVTGGALGVDQDAAGEWRRMGLPYLVAIPFQGQERPWPTEAQRIYNKMLDCAVGTVVVSQPPTTVQEVVAAMHARNEWMATVSDHLISVWDGSNGGTANCTRTYGEKFAIRINLHEIREHCATQRR